MRIGFIGAGSVATAFGRYLHAQGITIAGYFDRHADKVRRACENTHSRACQNAVEVAQHSDMILITTRDDQIAGVCRELCRQKAISANHWVGHMSGAHASLILSEALDFGAAIFSLHPLQAFAQEQKALADLPHTYFSLEGTDARLEAVEKVMAQTGNPCFRIAPEHKSLYHLAACVFSNYLVTLMHDGMEALRHSGIDPQEGFQAMLPLIQGTIANIAQVGPAEALTGPIARGDASTMRQHLAALDAQQMTAFKNFYTFMGLKTLELATQSVLRDQEKVGALKALLS